MQIKAIKFSAIPLIPSIGLGVALVLAYFTLFNRMYIYTMNYFIITILIILLNFLTLIFYAIKRRKNEIIISGIGSLLSILPFISLIYTLYKSYNAY